LLTSWHSTLLIPSIDLKNGRVVQLVQGEKLALEDHDLDAWIARFSTFSKVQLIDLDAAMGLGSNDALVKKVAAALPVRVGGGVRSSTRARELLAAGAHAVIVGSSLFNASTVDLAFARELADAVGVDRVIAAVDSKAGHVVVHGWKTRLSITAVEAVRALEPYCGEFLYTHVDKEGLMQGTDMGAIRAVRDATTRRVTAAGGITTRDEIDALDAMGVDAVVGMAIYTGVLRLEGAERKP
jgi:phosphoribosylformimino-5-aminoimidazole carboxamide ribotide isomerase